MKITKYPDGTSYVSANYGHENPHLIFKINSYEDLWHLNQLVDSLNHQGKLPTITIPNLIDAQADRRFDVHDSSGLKLVCKFLNGMNAKFRIFHPHNPEVVEALMDNVEIIDNTEFINNVLLHLITQEVVDGKPNTIDDNLILMSSDAGGFKPLMKLCNKLEWLGETYSASKSRKWDNDTKESILVQNLDRVDFRKKDILIIDDICVYGGTFKGLSELLQNSDAGKLYLAVSHMTIQNFKDSSLFDAFDKVFTTNSKYDNYFIPNKDGGVQPKNLEIIKQF